MAKNERFKIVYSQGTVDVTQILVDTETGVNYVFRKVAYAGGLTPLLDKEGKPGDRRKVCENEKKGQYEKQRLSQEWK